MKNRKNLKDRTNFSAIKGTKLRKAFAEISRISSFLSAISRKERGAKMRNAPKI